MVARQPAGSDWLGRVFPLLISALLGLCSAGIVFYFSSKAAEIETLRTQVTANTQTLAVMGREIELRRGARDAQLAEMGARLDRLERRR